MRRITYIANPGSVHVGVWLKAAAECEIPVQIETAACHSHAAWNGEIDYLCPAWLKGPAAVRYLWAGLRARIRRRQPGEILHAHCTSGNGMVAWMSGDPYIVTTYGSEVLAADQRGRLYRWLIHRVLAGADRITATSPQMVEVLTNEHGVPRDRIHLFDLGLDTQTFRPAAEADIGRLRADLGLQPDEPVWVSVKRAIPMNRTIEIVEAFHRHCTTHTTGRLVIVCGDDIGEYSDRVKAVAAGSPHSDRIIVLSRWLEPSELAKWLQLADYAIAVPTSDQMSNSVLEAMACSAVPMLLDIPGYGSLRERGADVHWLQECSIDALAEEFAISAGWSRDEVRGRQQTAVEFIRLHYSNRSVRDELQQLYDLPSPTVSDALHAA